MLLEYTHLQDYLLYLKHKSYLQKMIEDRDEELAFSRLSIQTVFADDDRDSIYDFLEKN